MFKSFAFCKNESVVDPPCELTIYRLAMLLVVYHYVCPITHIPQGVDPLKILLQGCVIVDQGIYYWTMTMHLLRTHLREHLEPWQDTHPILISVPSKVYLLYPDAVEHICFLLGHHTDVQPLIEIHIGSTVTELSQ